MAATASQPSTNPGHGHLFASMDTDGTVLVRDMTGGAVADVVQTIRLYKGEYESGFIL